VASHASGPRHARRPPRRPTSFQQQPVPAVRPLLARAFGVRRWWWAIIAGTLYGVSDEFHQTFTPNRSGNDLGDLTADFIGSFIGATAWRLLHKWRADGTKTS